MRFGAACLRFFGSGAGFRLKILGRRRFGRPGFTGVAARARVFPGREAFLTAVGDVPAFARVVRLERPFLAVDPVFRLRVRTRTRRGTDLVTGRVFFRFVPTGPRFMKIMGRD